MSGFDEGKNMLRSSQVAERRRFFDKTHKDVPFVDLDNDSVDKSKQVRKTKKEKKSKEKENNEGNGIEKNAAAEKFLKVALKEEFKKKIEKEKITNVRNKELLNSEISAIALLVGKDILEDEFIINDIAESLDESGNFVLQEAYRKRIENIFDSLSISKINELLFDFYINGEMDREIAKLRKAIEEGNIYQGKIKELNADVVNGLKAKILEEFDKISRVKEDYLAVRKNKTNFALSVSGIEEVESIIHSIIMEEMLTDEIIIPLHVSNKEMEEKKQKTIGAEQVEKPADFKSEENIQHVLIKQDESIEHLNEHKDVKRIEELVGECKESAKKLKNIFGELKSHAVTDEDKMESLAFEKDIVSPLALEFKKLLENSRNTDSINDDTIGKFELVKGKLDAAINNIEILIKNHSGEHVLLKNEEANGVESELKWDKEHFDIAVQLTRKTRDELLDSLKENPHWKARKEKYKTSFLRLELIDFLEDVIEQEKIVSNENANEFILKVLNEVFAEEFTNEDEFNKLLRNVKI